MLDSLRQWLLGVVCCALVVSLAERLARDAPAVRLTGGALLILCMLAPLTRCESPAPVWDASAYEASVSALSEEYASAWEAALDERIAAETAAYIEDKAADPDLRASVTLRGGEPYAVTLYGTRDDALAARIEQELGIPEERQTWIESG